MTGTEHVLFFHEADDVLAWYSVDRDCGEVDIGLCNHKRTERPPLIAPRQWESLHSTPRWENITIPRNTSSITRTQLRISKILVDLNNTNNIRTGILRSLYQNHTTTISQYLPQLLLYQSFASACTQDYKGSPGSFCALANDKTRACSGS